MPVRYDPILGKPVTVDPSLQDLEIAIQLLEQKITNIPTTGGNLVHVLASKEDLNAIENPPSNTIYLIPNGNTGENRYDEYMWVNNQWECFEGGYTEKLLAECVAACGYSKIPQFDENTTYLENSLVMHNGKMWRFTTLHQGAWNAANATETSLYTEIQNMRSSDKEQVLVRLSTYDNASIDWTTLFINVTFDNDAPVSYYLDENGQVTFAALKGQKYTIDFPALDGYTHKGQESYKALINTRTISYEYRKYQAGEASVQTEKVIVYAHVYNANFTRYATHAAASNAGLADISPYGKEVILSIDDLLDANGDVIAAGGVYYATYDENFRAEFNVAIPYGATYTVSTVRIDGTTNNGQNKKGIADYPEAYFYFSYTQISLGLTLMDNAGNSYDISLLSEMSDEQKANLRQNGVIRVESEKLTGATIDDEGNTGAGFLLKLPIKGVTKMWANKNVEFLQTYLPFKANAAAAQEDFKGRQNTRYIRAIGDGLEGGTGSPSQLVETPAADYCENPNWGETTAREDSNTSTCCPALYINGLLHPAYLGAAGQWHYGIKANAAAILAIQQQLDCNGLNGNPSAVNLASGYWWASTQHSATYAWNLTNGSLNNNLKTNTSTNALPFYDLHPVGT